MYKNIFIILIVEKSIVYYKDNNNNNNRAPPSPTTTISATYSPCGSTVLGEPRPPPNGRFRNCIFRQVVGLLDEASARRKVSTYYY
jgi:hypothetical protein